MRETMLVRIMKLLLVFLLFQGIISAESYAADSTTVIEQSENITPLSVFENAYKNHAGNIQVCQKGKIISILKDDIKGPRHQRFIIKLENGQTLLIAHNIDIAKRIPGLKINKQIMFYGEYEWNNKGGVIHWTHRDPDGNHIDGWIEYDGIKYQ
jgi:hypothetical protein